MLFGIASRSVEAANRPNLYSPYQQVVNLATGMSWPNGQAFPTFAAPFPILDTILIQDLTKDEQITFFGLQGVINKTRPRVYVLDSGADEGTYTWAGTSLVNFSNRTLYTSTTKYNLISKYAAQLSGVVLYDPAKSIHYRNLAGTVAGLKNAIPVTPEVYAAITGRAINLPVVADLTTLTYTTPNDIYNYMYDTYWPECNKRLVVSANPDETGDLYRVRDMAAATGSAIVWLSTTSSSQKSILRKFFADMTPGNAIVLGWYTTERSGITTATGFGIGTIPSDFFISSTVYAGTDHRIRVPKVPVKPALENKIYITIFISDGDNAQYMQRAMRKIWDQNASSRGKFPMNWTVAPGMVDLGPALLNYYYTTATTNDCFVAGPSGMGYIMPINTFNERNAPEGDYLTNSAAMDGYAKLTETYMQRAGLRVLTIWDNASAMHRASYAAKVRNLYGATVQRFSGNSTVAGSVEDGRVRFDRLAQAYSETYTNARSALVNQIDAWDGQKPLFISTQVSVWGEMKPNRIVDLCNELNGLYPGKLVFVRADHYFNLYNEANNLPFNVAMAAQTTVTGSAGGVSPAQAMDGSAYTTWSSGASGTRSLTFNFGKLYNLSRYVIRHAGDGGLSQTLNTRDYRVRVSADGVNWATIDTCTGNQTNVSDIEIPAVTVQYVRLIVDSPGADSTARVADVELFGANPLQVVLPQVDAPFRAWMEEQAPADRPPLEQQGQLDAPAGDGMSNLMKYALGLKPMTPAAEGPKLVAVSGDTMAVELVRSKTSQATYAMEGSPDMKTWSTVQFTTEVKETLSDNRERVRFVTAKPGSDAYFVRLKIIAQE